MGRRRKTKTIITGTQTNTKKRIQTCDVSGCDSVEEQGPRKQKQLSLKTSIKDLPVEMYLNIVERLPITSFLSMRLVSNDFYRLASHPEVILHFHNLDKNPYGLIIRILSSSIHEPRYTNQLYLVDSRRVLTKIIQPRIEKTYNPGPVLSSNGLLCLLFYKHEHPGTDYYRACLFNPLTGQHDFLLDPGSPRVRESSCKDTVPWFNQFFGFGFNVRTEEYKLVRIAELSYVNHITYLQAEVFTFGKNGCEITEIDTPFVCPDQSSDVVVGGAIHWLCEDENSTWFDPKPRIILSFDLLEEKFREMATPDCEIDQFCKISVLGGCLAITSVPSVYHARHEVHIWMLNGVKESWTKEFVIGESFGRLYPLYLLNSGNIVMSDEKAVRCYDPVNNYCEVYGKLDQSIMAICHVPSLVEIQPRN